MRVSTARAIDIAREVTKGLSRSYVQAAVDLSVFVLESLGDVESPFALRPGELVSQGGGQGPAEPATEAPVSPSVRPDAPGSSSPGGASGVTRKFCGFCGSSECDPTCFAKGEEPTSKSRLKPVLPTRYAESSQEIPVVRAPSDGFEWHDNLIVEWLLGHAKGEEHAGRHEVADALREKADGIRRREYLPSEQRKAADRVT